jgi:hypothetical protein
MVGLGFIVRLIQRRNPWVRAALVDGERLPLPIPIRLSCLVAQHAGRRLDLDVEYKLGC